MRLPQTLTALPREARDTLFMLLVIAWVIAPQSAHLPLWASAFAGALLLWRGVLAWRGQPLPRAWVAVLLLGLAVAATWATYRTIIGRDPGVTLIVILLGLKTLEMRARRDAMVIFFLGFFTLLSHFFFSQSLAVAAAMLVGLLGLLTAVVNAHLPVGRPPLALALRTAARMALLGTPIMLVLFMLFPRIAPLWGVPSENVAGRSGLSGSMEVGHLAELALDDSVALRVLFDSPGNAAPPQSQLYFRGPVLGQFDGRNWRSTSLQNGPSWAANSTAAANLQVQGEPLRYAVTLEPHHRPWLLVLDAAPERPEISGTGAFMGNDLQWFATRPITEVTRYRATSYPQFRHGPLEYAKNTDSADPLRWLTRLPAHSNPRTMALAQQLLADPAVVAGGTPALIEAALTLLRTGGYEYTLAPGVYGEHTADEFWFDQKAGFCEHIASAFAVLMRAAGVPARIVTGYQGGERNSVDGYWTVRQSDAHAWTEVWIEGRGWVRVDPTGAVSPGRIGQLQRLQAPRGVFGDAMGAVISPNMAQHLRALWEAANNHWNQWVLNYTQTRQLDLLKSLGFESPDWQDLTRLLAAVVGVVALAGAAWALWERRQHDPWLRLLAHTRQRLARAGLSLPDSTPPRAMAHLAQAHFGTSADPLAQWLVQLEQWRYAPHSPSAPLQTLRTLGRQAHQLPWPIAPSHKNHAQGRKYPL
jgi:transglutaminase-like putative cysteine protease